LKVKTTKKVRTLTSEGEGDAEEDDKLMREVMILSEG
jgi:hypothetical protein